MTTVVLSHAGELDLATIPLLIDRLAAHRQPGRRVVLDLRGVTFMDCYALGQIIKLHARSAVEGWTLHLRAEAPIVLRLLDLTGAANFLSLELPAPA
jgi:anti-anti-sigma factor